MRKLSDRENEVIQTAIRMLCEDLNPERILFFIPYDEDLRSKGPPVRDFALAVAGIVPDQLRRWDIEHRINAVADPYTIEIVYLTLVHPDYRGRLLTEAKVVYEQRERL